MSRRGWEPDTRSGAEPSYWRKPAGMPGWEPETGNLIFRAVASEMSRHARPHTIWAKKDPHSHFEVLHKRDASAVMANASLLDVVTEPI